MISIKKYLDSVEDGQIAAGKTSTVDKNRGKEILPVTILAYRSALMEMGKCSLDACPALGEVLKDALDRLQENLTDAPSCKVIDETKASVQTLLEDWGRRTANHYLQKTDEVKEILLVMARTAESVGERDQRCARQINDVTARLNMIANLDDLSQIRSSIEKSAVELKTSVDRMAAEGTAAIEHLRVQVSTYQARMEEAEEIAARDALTELRSRMCMQGHMERRIEAGLTFCVAIADIDHFKQVNDNHGHIAGDEVLKQFAHELKLACRRTDIVGRWGGDEFIILFDCGLEEAAVRNERIAERICGIYTVQGNSGPVKLRVDASIGLAEYLPNETTKELLARADAQMYERKADSRFQGAA
jgi:diguanylate cyclase (GGDEF)-like protein